MNLIVPTFRDASTERPLRFRSSFAQKQIRGQNHYSSNMADPSKFLFKEVLPKQGQVYQEDMSTVVLCKPKLLPLKSVTLEKMEKMQREAQELVKQQKEGSGEEHMGFTPPPPPF